MISKNLKKRFYTSLLLFFLLILVLKSNLALTFILLIFGSLSVIEFFSITRIIFKNPFFKLIINFIFLIYAFLFCYLFFVFIHFTNLKTIIFIILLGCISSDIGGYIFGKIFRWKSFTNISPNKTLSGVIGSLIFSIFSILLLGLVCKILFQIDLSFFLKFKYFIIALILSLSAQLGDLMVSYFKRLDKIKDTGKILPGHGGIFDRIDSLMLSIIVANILYYLKLFP